MANKIILQKDDLAVHFHPGVTLSEIIQELDMSVKEFAIRSGKPEKTIHAILQGYSSITSDMAVAFESVTHIPARFWINKQAAYDEFVTKERVKETRKREIDWAKAFPYPKMAERGWVPPATKIADRLNNLLLYFRMSSKEAWEDYYMSKELKIAFRFSLANTKDPYAVSAWLRQGEIEAEKIELSNSYSKEALKLIMPTVLNLLKDYPRNLQEQLQQALRDVGVKLIFLRTLPKAPISGCSRWIKDTPCIFLSDWHKRYDGFCFSLLHEICHILKHGKKQIFLEEVVDATAKDEKEIEADEFAMECLWPKKREEAFVANHDFSAKSIYMAAKRDNVHPSVIVGRLQHGKVIPYYYHKSIIKEIHIE